MKINAVILIIFAALVLTVSPVYAATADWTSSQGENSEYLTVSFTGSISGANASTASQWVWNFGDGTVGTGRTPSHTYGTPSSADDLIWTVNLTVTTDAVDGSEVVQVADRDITLTEPSLHASYTVSPSSSGDAPLTATFTDATFGRHSIISWDFRDGSLTTTQNPVTHTFETPGQYYVKLTVNRDSSQDSWEKKIEVLNPTPVPLFHTNVSSGKYPLTVQFTDDSGISYGNITGWSWDFGDGYTSSEQNPVHTYTDVGNYDVKLTVTSNAGKSDTLTRTDCINTESGFSVSFYADNTTGRAPFTVKFTSTSTGNIDSYFWKFECEDVLSDFSTKANPEYTFRHAGEYTVTLKVTVSENGTTFSDNATRKDYITVTEAPVTATATPTAAQTTATPTQTAAPAEAKSALNESDMTVAAGNSVGKKIFGLPGTEFFRDKCVRYHGFYQDYLHFLSSLFGMK
jgi:PKD repeat protein